MNRIILPLIMLLSTFSLLAASADTFAADAPILLPIEVVKDGIPSAGYINSEGKTVIPLIYESAKNFSDGLAVVQDKKTGRFGAINKQGKVMIPMVHDELKLFSEGLAAARKSELWGFIDTNGNWVVKPMFLEVFSHQAGVAAALSPVTQKYGFITRLGEWIVPPVFDTVKPFSEGLALVTRTRNDVHETLFINKKAELVVLAPAYLSFQEGLAPTLKDGKVGFIDAKGTWVIEPNFDYALPFSDGLATVYDAVENKWGFINKQGQYMIPPSFSPLMTMHSGLGANIASFHAGIAYVGDGFIDKQGQYVIQGDFISSTNFRNGFAKVIKLKYNADGNVTDGIEGYINTRGEFIWSKPVPYIDDIIVQAAKYGSHHHAFFEDHQ
ncbi:hypothetical protein BEP19_03035 [Ammoniphilus oxalaticus]|uniref:WG repeat-containing protein n=1 Tax=Ammoniphilus oxalaticus TaxID=66863 RepID=A0A419SNW2_9BACL|nr:WG repeat-containing protein [Ammoniphilus oxalaticus]RKD25919.1 hypothetical protein BEP19_03035 [Ammoniphilus oxalaticus]